MLDGLKPNTTEYKKAFAKEKYDSFLVYVPKGEKEKIKEAASAKKYSLNAFIVEAIREKIEKEKTAFNETENEKGERV